MSIDPINPIPIAPLNYPTRTLTQVTPFTYRDNLTYANILEFLRSKMNEVIAGYDDQNFNMDKFAAQVKDEINRWASEFNGDITTWSTEFRDRFNDAISDFAQEIAENIVAAAASAAAAANSADAAQGALMDSTEFVEGIAAKRTDFRHIHLTGLSYHESNVVLGSHHNAINSSSGDAAILSGGRDRMENVIGGREENVNDFDTTNLPADSTGAYDYSVIVGGYDNVLNALASFIAGQHCLISSSAGGGGVGAGNGHHAILGGSLHKITGGTYHAVLGGTEGEISATGNADVVVGGEGGEIDGSAAFSAIVGGKTNRVSGSYSAILAGTNSVVEADSASVISGNQNVISAAGSGSTVGGRQNQSDAQNATAFGFQVLAGNPGSIVFGNGQFGAKGDAQSESFTLRRLTTDATTLPLGIAGGSTPAVVTPDTVFAFTAHVVAQNIDPNVEQQSAWKIEGAVRRPATGGAQLLGTPTITRLGNNVGAAAWEVGVTTGTGAVNINVTGEADKSVRWVARVDGVSVRG